MKKKIHSLFFIELFFFVSYTSISMNIYIYIYQQRGMLAMALEGTAVLTILMLHCKCVSTHDPLINYISSRHLIN
jgi:hypothetical protein